jgi:ABC-type transport system involved in multi-copper enzyme maturation permease subunit
VNAAVVGETIRRHLTSVPFIVFVVLISGFAALTGATHGPSEFWHGFLSLLFIILACQLIGPEFTSGTLQLILAKPVNRSVYLLSRVSGVVMVIWVAVWIPFALDAGARLLSQKSELDWKALLAGAVNLSLHAILMCALMALFGSLTRSYLNVAIYFILQIGLTLIAGSLEAVSSGSWGLQSFATFIRDHPGIVEALRTVSNNLFPSAGMELSLQWTLMVITNAAVALFLACMIFRRREVPYGAD